MTQNDTNILIKLITAYWTPERIELWHQYEKTGRSIPWREYERMNRKEKSNANGRNSARRSRRSSDRCTDV